MKGALFATSLFAVAATVAAAPTAEAAEPKYFFQIKEVTTGPDVDPAVKTAAADALKAELASDIQATNQAALAAELTKRNLRGFEVTVRIENFKKEMKDPRPGGRLKQLAVNVKLVIIGATIPDAKMAFEGNGESGVEAEVAEKRMAADSERASKTALKSAVKQAVEEVVIKLGAKPAAAPSGKKPAKKKT